jgi:TonB family protein
MKLHTAAVFILLMGALAATASGQDLSYWVRLSPADEQFSVMVPPPVPESETQKSSYGTLEVDATVYSVIENRVTYAVWSLKNRNYQSAPPSDVEDYLDDSAELVWESLLKARRERLAQGAGGRMIYEHGLQAGGLPGRQYQLRLGSKPGVLRLFVDDERIYVLTVFNAGAGEVGAQRFLSSFEPDRNGPVQRDAAAQKDTPLRLIGPGRGGSAQREEEAAGNASGGVDYDRIFTPKEVTERARLTSRPPPAYTETARKYQVSGTVVLQAVLSKAGEVVDISVVRGLPHGLTRTSIEAMKLIKFIPATKDDVRVSQRIMVEYNYNLY